MRSQSPTSRYSNDSIRYPPSTRVDDSINQFVINSMTDHESIQSNSRGTRAVDVGGFPSPRSVDLMYNSSVKLSSDSLPQVVTRKEELRLWYQKLIKTINHSINIIQAVMLRILFSLHSLVAIFYVFLVKQDEWYLVNIIGVVFLGIELFITIVKRKGKEPRWFESFLLFFA